MGTKDQVSMQTKFSVYLCVCVCPLALLARGIAAGAKADTLCYSSLCSILFEQGQNVLHRFLMLFSFPVY